MANIPWKGSTRLFCQKCLQYSRTFGPSTITKNRWRLCPIVHLLSKTVTTKKSSNYPRLYPKFLLMTTPFFGIYSDCLMVLIQKSWICIQWGFQHSQRFCKDTGCQRLASWLSIYTHDNVCLEGVAASIGLVFQQWRHLDRQNGGNPLHPRNLSLSHINVSVCVVG